MLQTFTTAAAGLSTGLIDYLRDPEELLLALGPYVLIGVAVIVFIESGLLFPFLPGDSLLFTAGLSVGTRQAIGLAANLAESYSNLMRGC